MNLKFAHSTVQAFSEINSTVTGSDKDTVAKPDRASQLTGAYPPDLKIRKTNCYRDMSKGYHSLATDT